MPGVVPEAASKESHSAAPLNHQTADFHKRVFGVY